MLVTGETFFSAVTTALNFLFDDMFLTRIISPILPSERASPYVEICKPDDADTISIVSLLFTAFTTSIWRGFKIMSRDMFFLDLCPTTRSMSP